jgi:hypothetical protein
MAARQFPSNIYDLSVAKLPKFAKTVETKRARVFLDLDNLEEGMTCLRE